VFYATLLRVDGKSLQSVGFEADAVCMSHRLTPALLCTLVLAAAPATASAQAQPDERANARAFADAGIQLEADVEAVAAGLDGSFVVPRCKSDRRLSRATGRQQEPALVLVAGQVLGQFGRAVTPALDRANAGLAAIPTADPALIDGRAAWARIGRAYGTLAKLRHARICIELRNYVRHDFKPTRAMRRAAKAIRKLARLDIEDIDAKLGAAVDRLVELGIPADEAAAFGAQDTDEDDGAAYEALPVPSSPLKLLRAAS
jgi:hypothetical protein